MKRFKFSLDKVLSYDEYVKKRETDVLGRLQTEYRAIEARRDAAVQEDRAVKRQFLLDCERGQTAAKAVATARYIEELKRRIEDINVQLTRQAEKVEAQRQKLIQAARDVQVIENLRDRRYKGYQAAQVKYNERFIEGFVSNRIARDAEEVTHGIEG
ncbi:flagellar FliJ family protein [Bacillota bacterium Meth-B3]|nr:flagellar FliJ family protein [Christensenellaceae bacterium]MEA5066212.1 flagellar FliJ family protein [Eubacteriales bacterium]